MAGDTDRETVAFSEIDSERFGVRVAKANVTSHCLSRVLDFCAADRIDLLIARCSTSDLEAAQGMEAKGFLLMDSLLYYSFDLTKKEIPEDSCEVRIRRFLPGDETEIQRVASAAFKGYMGHYHADRRLDSGQCDEAYRSWAERSSTVGKGVADEVLVAEIEGKIAGFATLRLNSPHEVEGLLFAVAPESQGKGICRLFMIRSLQWCRAQGATRMVISTQVTNVPMQKVWCRAGFEPSHSYYTFHKWFTPEKK
jgi:GNAT superfamily N-acetyltransferase